MQRCFVNHVYFTLLTNSNRCASYQWLAECTLATTKTRTRTSTCERCRQNASNEIVRCNKLFCRAGYSRVSTPNVNINLGPKLRRVPRTKQQSPEPQSVCLFYGPHARTQHNIQRPQTNANASDCNNLHCLKQQKKNRRKCEASAALQDWPEVCAERAGEGDRRWKWIGRCACLSASGKRSYGHANCSSGMRFG